MSVSTVHRLTFLAAAVAGLSACSSINNATGRISGLVSPYKVEVVQGNFVSKEQRDALAPGMPRAQVRDILGSPLVTSVFHADRWDYVFTIQRQGQPPQQRKLTVFFRGDELLKVEGDEMISEDEFVTSLAAGRRLGKVPLLEVPPELLREFGIQATAAQASAAADGARTSTSAAASYPPLEAPGAVTSAWDASTQRAVAASAVARSAAPAVAAAAPILVPQAPAPAPAPAASSPAPRPASPAPAMAPAPAPAVAPAPAAVVASATAPAPAPVRAPVPAPAPAPMSQQPTAGPSAPVPPTAAPASAAPAPAASPVAAPPAVAATPRPAPAALPPAPASAPASAPAAIAPSPAAALAAAAPAPTLQAPAPSSNLLASADPDITTLLNRWTTDWQSRNVAAYFSHYVPEFKGTSSTRAEWEALRRTRIEGRTRISLAALDVRVRMVSPTEARLVFRQVFESDAFTEIGTKAMFLVKRDGRWLIEREFFTPAQ